MTPTSRTDPRHRPRRPVSRARGDCPGNESDTVAPRWQTPLLTTVHRDVRLSSGVLPGPQQRPAGGIWPPGRDVARGQLPFDRSVPPSADPTAGPTWLYDLFSYSVYSVAGGAGLVFAKALLVAGVGLVLLRLSRTGTGWWLPMACTVLALLAMGTRLMLQPVVASVSPPGPDTTSLLKDRDEADP